MKMHSIDTPTPRVPARIYRAYGPSSRCGCRGRDRPAPPEFAIHTLAPLRRRALLITETELKLIAAAAIMGLSKSPNAG